MIKKPMLAENAEDISAIKFPVACTPKLDGIRCLKINGQALSRKFKAIPNRYIREMLEQQCPDGLDGELMIKNANFNSVQSGVMSEDGKPDFEYWVFDYVDASGLHTPYMNRMEGLGRLALPPFCKKVLPWIANSVDELNRIEAQWLAQGFEGVMMRSLSSPYKCGRSTLREGYLLKLKQFKDSEAVVVGFEELMSNQNEAEIDELGHTKRSSHKENLVPANTLGKFIVKEIGENPWKGQEFKVGTGKGLTAELRKEIWENRSKYLGRVITYRYQPHGMKDLPRIPIWHGFRDPKDMD